MKLKGNFLLTIVCTLFFMLSYAEAGESYGYITSDVVVGSTTQRTDTDRLQDAREVMSNYDDMSGNGYINYYTIPGLKETLTYNTNTKQFVIATNRYVPQGICTVGNYILITAHDSEKVCSSVVYVLNKSTNKLITTLVLPKYAHAGGIAYDSGNSYIWVCTDGGYVSGFSYDLLYEAVSNINNSSGAVRRGIFLQSFAKEYKVKTEKASYCTYFDGMLWVGLFDPNSTADIYGYTINLTKSTLTAKYIIEAPKETQGIAFYKYAGTVYLVVSCSEGKNNDSTIILYKPSYSSPQTVSGQTYKRILKNTRVDSYKFSPLAEGVCINSSDVYVIFESGAYKYLDGSAPFDQYIIYDVNDFLQI